MNDGELNDSELGRELSALTPDPAPDYWTRIDAMLAGVEAERQGDAPSVGEDSHPDDHADTDDNVVRLTDMNQPRDLPNRFNRSGGLILAAAASLVALLAVAGLLVLRDDSTNLDATTDDSTTESTPAPDDGTTDTTTPPDQEATTSTSSSDDPDGSAIATPIAGTYCYYEANTEMVDGEHALRLIVRADGAAVAAERFVRPDGQTFVTTATGFVLDESDQTFAMTADLDGQVLTRIWRISENGLSTGWESFIINGDCADVDEALAAVDMPQPVVPAPELVDAALDAGTYCWQIDDNFRGIYQLTVGDDGTVSAISYGTNDSEYPTLTMIETGTGVFVTANEVALNLERWRPAELTTESVIYTLSGDELAPTSIDPGFLATPVDCAALDEWRLPTEGLNIYTDEELRFEPGTTGATVEGGFIRGELVVYRVEATKGQSMTVTISSLEDNAAVRVYSPERLAILVNEEGSGAASVVLPESGVYQIVVSSIRGNVSYTLDVDIR